jgi:transposase-like protein
MDKQQIKDALLKLSPSERSALISEVELEQDIHSKVLARHKEQLNNKQGCCPHCGNNKYRKHGIDKGSQRYKCKSCGRTFTEYTGTWMARLHKKDLVGNYLKLMEQELSLDKIKVQLGINKKTAFDWRHKILSGLRHSDKESFDGITESDDTFFRFSEKGSRNLDRKPRKRGGAVTKRGNSDQQVAVIVTADRGTRTDLTVAGLGRIRKADIAQAIGDRISQQTILCSDSHVSYKGFAIDNNLEHHALRSDLRQRVSNGIYHIQHVNAIDSRLKQWLRGRFGGVSTKYLQRYLNWFRAKELLKQSTHFIRDFTDKSLQDMAAINHYNATQCNFEKLCNLQR